MAMIANDKLTCGEHSEPLAEWSPLVRVTDGEPTGQYELRVGNLYLRSNEWDKANAEKWMPIIVNAVNKEKR